MERCDSRELLKSHRIRITRRKTAILCELVSSDRPLSAAELHNMVSASIRLDPATVYRSLNILVKNGIIREITDGRGTQRFEIACRHNPVHPHFKCVKCRKITCLTSLASEDTAGIISIVPPHCEVTGITITVTGICKTCGSEA